MSVMELATKSVFKKSKELNIGGPIIQGYDFSDGINFERLFSSFLSTGAQASQLGKAINQINEMLTWRLIDDPIDKDADDKWADEELRKKTKCFIFLGYTSNMISCGTRETIRFLAKNKLIDCIVTTCGGIEEDLMKCFGTFQLGDFTLDGTMLREMGQNRIGNIIVSNDHYCSLEDFLSPIFGKMLLEQKTHKMKWTPSKMIARLGKEINNEDSVYYWCYKNNIPVFCPAMTDGAIGDNLFFFASQKEGLVLDIIEGMLKCNR
jgi:deoxyhypusine synthase